MKPKQTFIALLRGINVGGRSKVDMAQLRAAFDSLGCENVKTLLNSGNVIFESQVTDQLKLRRLIEVKLREVFGREISVIVRAQTEIVQMLEADPFREVVATTATRLYVSFLSEPSSSSLPIPYQSPNGSFTILKVTDNAVFSVLNLTHQMGTTDAMKILEKEFGNNITTRNWNTVCKLAK